MLGPKRLLLVCVGAVLVGLLSAGVAAAERSVNHTSTPNVLPCPGCGGGGLPTCPYSPNYYASGLDTTNGGDHYGVRGYIKSTTFSVPQTNHNFSDAAFHAIEDGTGLEVGWFIGWAPEWGVYWSSPHAYSTLNDADESDGPSVGNATDFYSTYWSGSTQIWNVRTTNGGTILWSDSKPAGTSGPGQIAATGEVNDNSLHMAGEFDGVNPELQFFSGDGAWNAWQGVSLCADTNFFAFGDATSITVGGN